MKTITGYQISNGDIFTNEVEAKKAEENLLGEELDGLLKLFALDITRNQEYKSLLQLLPKRKELEKQILKILEILKFQGEEA